MSTPAANPSSQSFQVLAKQWAREIAATARALATPSCPASDLEQAGLIALWRAALTFRSRRGPFDHYFRRAMKRSMKRERERVAPFTVAQHDVISLSDEELEKVSYEIDPFSDAKAVAEWVDHLPARLAQIFDLLYRQGYTQVEAGGIMGVTQGRVAQLRARLLERGRVELGELAA